MSFFGLSSNTCVNTEAAKTMKKNWQNMDLYYEGDTKIKSGADYHLFTIGNIILDSTASDVELALEKAHGTFCYVLFKEDKLIIGTDNMGFYPLYYTRINGFTFANFLPHIKHRIKNPEINWDAWNEILNGQDILGNKTTIKNIYRLRQGEKIIYRGSDFKLQSFTIYSPKPFVDDKTYIEQNNQLLIEGMGVLCKSTNTPLIPLTGGHDSRRIALAAKCKNLDFYSITQETNALKGYDPDTLVATQLAKEFEISEHIKLNMPDLATIRNHKLLKDYWCGFESHQHEWAVNISKSIKKNSLLLDGIIGDVTINNHYSFEYPQTVNSNVDIHNVILSALPQPIFSIKDKLLSTDIQSTITAELGRFDNDPNQLTLYKIFNHTRRNIGHWFTPFLLENHQVALPYGYLPLFNQSLTLDPKLRLDAQYQKNCMSAMNKNIADLPSTRDNLSTDYWKQAGAKAVRSLPNYYDPRTVNLSNSLYSNFDRSFKDFIHDNILYKLGTEKAIKARAWHYIPLQRLALFKLWLETDESYIPILDKNEPLFVTKALR